MPKKEKFGKKCKMIRNNKKKILLFQNKKEFNDYKDAIKWYSQRLKDHIQEHRKHEYKVNGIQKENEKKVTILGVIMDDK